MGFSTHRLKSQYINCWAMVGGGSQRPNLSKTMSADQGPNQSHNTGGPAVPHFSWTQLGSSQWAGKGLKTDWVN